jgi:hypothetical protein
VRDDALSEMRFSMRNELSEIAAWGKMTKRLYVHELATPAMSGSLERSQESVGCAYFDRTVLLVRVSGGMLAASPRHLVAELAKAGKKLEQRQPTPARQLRATVSWLEEQQREGLLHRSYSTASIIITVSNEEVWSWHVGPHGTFSGTVEMLSFQSTDARMPVLYEHGVPKPAFRAADSELRDKATSVFNIGSPAGYECIRHEVGATSLVVEADRGALPFGPLTRTRTWSLRELCEHDAAWRYGLPGRALIVGRLPELQLPTGWEVRTSEVRD